MKKYHIITNTAKDPNYTVTGIIRDFLEHSGCVCSCSDARETERTEKTEIDAEVIIVLGGDGTLLRAARDTVDLQIPLIGVNLGNLGFLAEIGKDDLEESLRCLIRGNYTLEHRMMLTGTIYHEDMPIASDCALNDIVISKDLNHRLIRTHTYINNTRLTSVDSDGLIISTPTGSTGYSLSLGGPIISPEASVFLITPMAPHTLVNRSVIIQPDRTIRILLDRNKDGGDSDAFVSFDGDSNIRISSGDRIMIRKAEKDTLIAKISDNSFMDVLSRKMNQ